MLNKNKKFKPGQVVWYMGAGGPIRTKVACKNTCITRTTRSISFELDNGIGARGCDEDLFPTKHQLLKYWKEVEAKRGY